MGHLQKDPTTGHLLKHPTTGRLANACADPAEEPLAECCAVHTPAWYDALFSGVQVCACSYPSAYGYYSVTGTPELNALHRLRQLAANPLGWWANLDCTWWKFLGAISLYLHQQWDCSDAGVFVAEMELYVVLELLRDPDYFHLRIFAASWAAQKNVMYYVAQGANVDSNNCSIAPVAWENALPACGSSSTTVNYGYDGSATLDWQEPPA